MSAPPSLLLPEKPAGGYGLLRWPIIWVPLGILMAGALTVLGGIIAVIVAALLGIDVETEAGSWFIVIGTIIQDTAMLFTVWWFIKRRHHPRLWHLGLRPTPFRHALSWAVSGMIAFYLLTISWGLLVGRGKEQEVLQDLGAGKGAIELIAAGLVVIVLAPIIEEIFFRGFIYAGLRSKYGPMLAALVSGVLFGMVHYTGPESLISLPVLGMLGVIFCVVYEKTGSLYPVIALHAFNNALAFSVGTGGDVMVGIVLGLGVIGGCVLAARLSRQPAAEVVRKKRPHYDPKRPEALGL